METRASKRIKTQASHARIELLPPEIRLQLLYSLDASSLWNLTRASSVFYQQYASRRSILIMTVLSRELGRVILDVLDLHQALQWRCDVSEDTHVDSHGSSSRSPSASPASFFEKPVSPEASRYSPINHPRNLVSDERLAVQMLFFHHSIMRTLREDMLLAFSQKEPGLGLDNEPASDVELSRVTRAMYRYELCCVLYGEYWSTKPVRKARWSEYAIVKQLYLMYEPWEIEEILCVFAYFQAWYCSVFNSISWCPVKARKKRDWLNRDWLKGPLVPPDMSGDSFSDPRLHAVYGMASGGCRLLDAMRKHQKAQPGSFLAKVKELCPRHIRRFLTDEMTLATDTQAYVRRDLRAAGLLEMNHSDAWPRGENLAAPSSAWHWLWDGAFSARLGTHLPCEARPWGYIFWQRSRLTRDVLERLYDNWDWSPKENVTRQREENDFELQGGWDTWIEPLVDDEDALWPSRNWYWVLHDDEP